MRELSPESSNGAEGWQARGPRDNRLPGSKGQD